MANINGHEIYFGIVGQVGGGGEWSDILISLIPAMTSDTTPEGTVIYSGEYNTDRLGYWAFDGVDSHTFSSHAWSENVHEIDGNTGTAYIGYLFSEERKLHSIDLATFSDVVYTAVLETYDGTSWTAQKQITIPTPSGYYNKQTVTLDNDVICQGIRLSFIAPIGNYVAASTYGCAVCEIWAYGYVRV